MSSNLKKKPDLSFATLWNLSFGFFGVQIAYALQSANISRIFATLGADPHNLSYFWILPPLMGKRMLLSGQVDMNSHIFVIIYTYACPYSSPLLANALKYATIRLCLDILSRIRAN